MNRTHPGKVTNINMAFIDGLVFGFDVGTG